MSHFWMWSPLLVLVYLLIMTAICQLKKDTVIANITWIGGVWLITVFALWWFRMYQPRPIIITLLITIWAARLIINFYLRYDRNDPRFITWRQRSGTDLFLFNLIYIFGVQLPLMILMAVPLYLVTHMCWPDLSWIDALGFVIWVTGFLFEALGDYQLLRFIRSPLNMGRVLKDGLWHYSRHPNYFGEILMWIGMALMAYTVHDGWMAIVAPITITIWLVYVAGIRWVEPIMGLLPEYQVYQRTTSKLIPWFPRGE